MVDEIGRLSAATAGGIDGEIFASGLFPLSIVTAHASRRPLRVGLGFALPGPLRHDGALLAVRMDATAISTDPGCACRHRQATGASAGWPLTITTPAVIEVPPFFVITVRMYRLFPM